MVIYVCKVTRISMYILCMVMVMVDGIICIRGRRITGMYGICIGIVVTSIVEVDVSSLCLSHVEVVSVT